MSTPPKSALFVQGVLGGAPGKRVLLVEGPNDKAVYSAWLKKLAYPGLFSAKVVVQDVEGRPAVLGALEWFRDEGGNPNHLFGVVDRDEWDSATIAARKSALPQLRVVPGRDCLDSYFSEPDELEPSLRNEDAAFAPQFAAFRTHLQGALPERVAHWALFATTERLKARMIDALYPGAFHAVIPNPPDNEIEKRFERWAGIVAHPQLFSEFFQLRSDSLVAPQVTQFRSHVSGKRFFEEVVYPAPDGLQRFRGKSVRDWRVDLAEYAPAVPADIAAILQPLLA